MLIKKAVSMRKHLERNRKDLDSKYRLISVESRIHRLARYYKGAGTIPVCACVCRFTHSLCVQPTWRYESSTASTMLA
jgi:small subunit ribosomal protein S13e